MTQTLHRKAMDYNFQADQAKSQGNEALYKELLEKAYQCEYDAAMTLYAVSNCEPARSILFRSAGWLAYNLGNYVQANKLAWVGYTHTIHEVMKKELLDLAADSSKMMKKELKERDFVNKKITDL